MWTLNVQTFEKALKIMHAFIIETHLRTIVMNGVRTVYARLLMPKYSALNISTPASSL